MDDDALERLQRRVESKGDIEHTPRHGLDQGAEVTPRTWTPTPARRGFGFMRIFTHFSFLELLFAGSIIFVVAAGAISALLVFSGSNTVSTRNVSVSVAGPTSIRAGEEVTLQVVVANRNAVPMNLTDLLIEYPPGTRSPLDVSIEQLRTRESLGTIEPGASVNRTIKAVMFGTAGQPVEVNVTAEYRVPSSNAVFQSESTYHATISQSPAAVTVETLSEVVSGQPTDITVTVTSNASENLTGMLLTATYPTGFLFEDSTPRPIAGTSVWNLGDIEPKGERKVVIRGTFTGEDGDDRVIHFTTGTKKRDDLSSIAAPLASTDVSVKVAKPFVSIQLELGGNTGTQVSAERGAVVKAEAHWTNNLPVRVQNVEIQIKLTGGILNKNSVRVDQGFFRSSDSTLIFNKSTDTRLADVEPGVSGVSTFEFATLPVGQGSFQSPTIEVSATVKANRSSEGGVVDTVTSSAKSTVQVATDLALTPVVTRLSGPVPPKVETETVYTITWLLQNSANAIANTAVTAVLPIHIDWKGGASSPDVSYNENTRVVTWSVGDMNANATRTVSFNIGLTPSITQVNNVPTLLEAIKVSAFDRFIRAQIERPMPTITTQTGTTPQNASVVP